MKKSSSSSRPQGQRQLRVGEEIRRILSSIFMRGECHDDELRGVSITVSEVRISPDLKNATAYVMPLGGVNAEGILATLNRLAPQLRHLVTQQIELRYSPKIAFKIDRSFEEAYRIETLLKRPDVARDLDDKE